MLCLKYFICYYQTILSTFRDFEDGTSLDGSIEHMERGSLASFGSGNTTDSDNKVGTVFGFSMIKEQVNFYLMLLFVEPLWVRRIIKTVPKKISFSSEINCINESDVKQGVSVLLLEAMYGLRWKQESIL